jgi:hypothetical protein
MRDDAVKVIRRAAKHALKLHNQDPEQMIERATQTIMVTIELTCDITGSPFGFMSGGRADEAEVRSIVAQQHDNTPTHETNQDIRIGNSKGWILPKGTQGKPSADPELALKGLFFLDTPIYGRDSVYVDPHYLTPINEHKAPEYVGHLRRRASDQAPND